MVEKRLPKRTGLICKFPFLVIFFTPIILLAQQIGKPLPPWKNGELDIYQISTGMGNSAFFIFPDGTNLLVDAGAINNNYNRKIKPIPKPNGSKNPGEWIARFVKRVMPKNHDSAIDYALITHFHDDHLGYPDSLSKKSPAGNYQLSGITELGSLINIHTMLDRSWPNYNFFSPITKPLIENYQAFLNWQIKNNKMVVIQFLAGQKNQIKLIHKPKQYLDKFEIRNIISNGNLWTGKGDSTKSLFPENYLPNKQNEIGSENNLSCAIRIKYGNFSYFTGGDLIGVPTNGLPAWQDFETRLAKVVEKIDVMVADHHAVADAVNEQLLKTLQPKTIIISAWAANQPDSSVIKRMLSKDIYPGKRNIFITSMLPESKPSLGATLQQFSSTEGHILVRVEPGGKKYKVIVIDDTNELNLVKAVFGPF